LALDNAVAPRTPTERAVADVWCEVLGLTSVGVYDSFFDVGGHSLAAIWAADRISRLLGIQLQGWSLFESPTIAALARVIDGLRAASEVSGPSEVPAWEQGTI
jgi:hypothetical protein